MYSTSKGNVPSVIRQNSRKKSSPKIIRKKTSVSKMEGSPQNSSLQLHHGSSQILSVSGSYSEVSASDFIQQCILNLPPELGTPVEMCPLPQGSDDFQKVMKEFTDDGPDLETAPPVEEAGHGDDGDIPPVVHGTTGTSRTHRFRHPSEQHTGHSSSGHPADDQRRTLSKKLSSGSMGSLEAGRSSRKHGGQWTHHSVNQPQPAQMERRSRRKGLNKTDDIFSFSSDEEGDAIDRPRVHTRHPVVRRSDSHGSTKDLIC